MNDGVIVWLVIFAVAAAVFFVVAVVVSIKGYTDLRTLLRHSEPKVGHETRSREEREES